MKLGVYRHYKGGLYLVLAVAHDANADNLAPADNAGRPVGSALEEREVVVYVHLEDGGDKPVWVRTLDDFNQELCGVTWEEESGERCWSCFRPLETDSRCVEHGFTNTAPVRRFAYVGGPA